MYDPISSSSIGPFVVAFSFALGSVVALSSRHVFANDMGTGAIVELTTTSGRTFRGTIAPDSDFNTVRLTTSRGSIMLTRPIAWTAIRHLTIDDQPSSFEQLASLITMIQATNEKPPLSENVLTVGPSELPRDHEVSVEQTEAGPHSAPIARLTAWATCKSWDRDPMIDGLEVTFAAEDAKGLPTAAYGHLEADLYAFQGESFNIVPHGQGAKLRKIGTWRVPLEQTFARYDSRVAQLAYQSRSPVTDGSVSAMGILVVRLIVPGQGTFSTTLEDIRLRPYSAIRDANTLRGNQRYFGNENPRYRPPARP